VQVVSVIGDSVSAGEHVDSDAPDRTEMRSEESVESTTGESAESTTGESAESTTGLQAVASVIGGSTADAGEPRDSGNDGFCSGFTLLMLLVVLPAVLVSVAILVYVVLCGKEKSTASSDAESKMNIACSRAILALLRVFWGVLAHFGCILGGVLGGVLGRFDGLWMRGGGL